MKWLKARLSKTKEWIIEKWKVALIAVGVVLVPLIVWKVPEWQVRAYHGRLDANAISKLTPQELIQLQKDLITAENNARVTIAQIIGGLVVLLGLYATFKNVKVAQDNHRVALDNLRVTEEGKLTDRFSKAVELLGSEELNVRLGGVYALERIAWDSQKDHWTVMEVLTAFIREQSKKDHKQWLEFLRDSGLIVEEKIKDKKPPADIQAALTVIGRRKWTEQEKPHQLIDLRDSFLAGAILSKANLRRALFHKSNLSGAYHTSADLTDASLNEAIVNNARFGGTNLTNAQFIRADVTDASFVSIHVEPDGRAILAGARFDDAKGITWKQISKAKIDETTQLPPELEERRKAEQAKKAAAPNQ